MKAITTPAILTRFSSRLDGSLGFGGETPELTSAEKAAFMDLQGLNVMLLIQPVDTDAAGMVVVKPEEPVSDGKPKGKSKSQALRAALYRLWEKEGQHEMSSEEFYDQYMTTVINTVLTKL